MRVPVAGSGEGQESEFLHQGALGECVPPRVGALGTVAMNGN